MPYGKFSVGVLFENSIVCHVFYAMALGLRMVLAVCGFGVICFGLPTLISFVVVGPGLVF